MKRTIRLRDITEAKDFVALTSRFPERMSLWDGDTAVDAKSIMALFSFDLTKPITLEIETDEAHGQEICRALSHYIIA